MGIRFDTGHEMQEALGAGQFISVYKDEIGVATPIYDDLDTTKPMVNFSKINSTGSISTVSKTVDVYDRKLLLCIPSIKSVNVEVPIHSPESRLGRDALKYEAIDFTIGRNPNGGRERAISVGSLPSMLSYGWRSAPHVKIRRNLNDPYSSYSPSDYSTVSGTKVKVVDILCAIKKAYEGQRPKWEEAIHMIKNGVALSVACDRNILFSLSRFSIERQEEKKANVILPEKITVYFRNTEIAYLMMASGKFVPVKGRAEYVKKLSEEGVLPFKVE